jgi:hypothetical protein
MSSTEELTVLCQVCKKYQCLCHVQKNWLFYAMCVRNTTVYVMYRRIDFCMPCAYETPLYMSCTEELTVLCHVCTKHHCLCHVQKKFVFLCHVCTKHHCVCHVQKKYLFLCYVCTNYHFTEEIPVLCLYVRNIYSEFNHIRFSEVCFYQYLVFKWCFVNHC